MAIFGWSTGKMAQHYTRTADRVRLARDAAELLLPSAQPENKNALTLGSGEGRNAKAQAKSKT
jgi:hypothetical protein